MSELSMHAGANQSQAEGEIEALMKKIAEGSASSDDLFNVLDKQGDKSGSISKQEFGVLLKRMKMKLTGFQVDEIFSSVKARSASKADRTSKELNKKEFKLALEYLQQEAADATLRL